VDRGGCGCIKAPNQTEKASNSEISQNQVLQLTRGVNSRLLVVLDSAIATASGLNGPNDA
jgi:hypothetical protein